MLQFLRKKKRLFMWIISPLIVVAFVFFYGWTGVGTHRGAPNELIEVGGRTIQVDEFYMEEMNIENYFRMMYDGQLPPEMADQFNFRRMALQNLLDRYYFLAGSDEFRVPVSERLIRRNIYQMFHGVNDIEVALQRYLRQMGMTERGFFSRVQAETASQTFSEMVRSSGVASALDLQRYFRDNHQKRNITYVKFQTDEFIDEVEYTEEDLQSYYEEYQEDYRIPEQYDIRYIQIEPEDVIADIEVSEEEIRNYYEAERDRFEEPERRDLKRIFISLDDPEDEEALEEKHSQIEEIRQRIMEEEVEFSDMAREYSDGPEGERGGDFGARARRDLPSHFAEPVFELDEGEITPVLEDRNGLYLFKVKEILPERTPPLEEVQSQIQRTIQEDRARDVVMEKADEMQEAVESLVELEDYGARFGWEIYESGMFSDRDVPGLGSAPAIFEQVQQLEVNEVGEPVRVQNKGIVFALSDREESYIPPLEEVRADIREEVQFRKATETAEQNARQFRRGLRGDHVNFDHMSAEFDKEIQTAEEIRRDRREVSGIGESREFVYYIFDAGLHQIGPVTEMVNEDIGEVDTFLVWYCSDIVEPDEETVKNNWGRGYNYWTGRYGNSLRAAMHHYLQDEFPMQVLHPEAETMLFEQR